MKFKLEISMDNDAFANGDNGREVGHILLNLSERLETKELSAGDTGSLKDTNGNSVGTWKVTR